MESRELTASYLLEKSAREYGRWSSLLPWNRLCERYPYIRYPPCPPQDEKCTCAESNNGPELPLLTEEYMLDEDTEVKDPPEPEHESPVVTYFKRYKDRAKIAFASTKDLYNPGLPAQGVFYTIPEILELFTDRRMQRHGIIMEGLPTQFPLSEQADKFYRRCKHYHPYYCLMPSVMHYIQNDIIGKSGYCHFINTKGKRWWLQVLEGSIRIAWLGSTTSDEPILLGNVNTAMMPVKPGYDEVTFFKGSVGHFQSISYLKITFLEDAVLHRGWLLEPDLAGESDFLIRVGLDGMPEHSGREYEEFLAAEKAKAAQDPPRD
ncbi:hypothetical protein PFICI_01059 [Pestalotiopsis fici W106-1]|uniref:Uncharacterized protein n=1 Tax=Pestalotiopsis fici (strain W106-1 / CGMCC3.15140) TaxID=1229662 RepID=W3XPS4_PESFW|nr:uncharacterized protein PFICI_01059 [Pestalotiopsis fici W106-1]ETS87231.1 hypothetical protein PFICI_01059 [Pestalotiopsis fici W106-1]